MKFFVIGAETFFDERLFNFGAFLDVEVEIQKNRLLKKLRDCPVRLLDLNFGVVNHNVIIFARQHEIFVVLKQVEKFSETANGNAAFLVPNAKFGRQFKIHVVCETNASQRRLVVESPRKFVDNGAKFRVVVRRNEIKFVGIVDDFFRRSFKGAAAQIPRFENHTVFHVSPPIFPEPGE